MNNIKRVIFLIILCFLIGWFLPDVVICILKTFNISSVYIKFTYLLGFTILLPLNQYAKIQPQLDSTKIVMGLKESEISRLNNILDIKKKQSKMLMIILLICTMFPLIINMILSQPIDSLFKLLVGSSIANIVYVFYTTSISEEISKFEKEIFLRNQKNSKKEKLLNEAKGKNK